MKKLTLALSLAIATIGFSGTAFATWSAAFNIVYVEIPQSGQVEIYSGTANSCGSGWYDVSPTITDANILNRMTSIAVAAKLAGRQLQLNTTGSCQNGTHAIFTDIEML